jgi:Trypsin-like peptidase domain
MLPTNIFYRTFFIHAAQYGTAFTLDVDGSEFLITAAHLLESASERQVIQIMRNGQWSRIECELKGAGRGELDVAVLRLPTRLTDPEFTVEPTFGNCHVGQDMFFLGFPYKMSVDYGPIAGGQPGAFLKKGSLSAVHPGPPRALYIDALNNEGFSGGPLYFFPNGDIRSPCIAGIVAKYKTEHESVLDASGQTTEMKVAYNTGFLVAYDIAHALELARR